MWRPKHVDPSLTLGTIVTALLLVGAVAVQLGLADQRAARRPQWRLKGAVALAAAIAAIVLQIVEWLTIGFGPSSGGYASVFLGWTAAQLVCVLGVVYWLETLLATAIRYRNVPHDDAPAGHASGDPHRSGHDIANPLSLVRPGLEALAFFWWFLAGAAIVAWIVLYLI
jgi:heme/copper-type cytochrome/quinol oxidase subunit 3